MARVVLRYPAQTVARPGSGRQAPAQQPGRRLRLLWQGGHAFGGQLAGILLPLARRQIPADGLEGLGRDRFHRRGTAPGTACRRRAVQPQLVPHLPPAHALALQHVGDGVPALPAAPAVPYAGDVLLDAHVATRKAVALPPVRPHHEAVALARLAAAQGTGAVPRSPLAAHRLPIAGSVQVQQCHLSASVRRLFSLSILFLLLFFKMYRWTHTHHVLRAQERGCA